MFVVIKIASTPSIVDVESQMRAHLREEKWFYNNNLYRTFLVFSKKKIFVNKNFWLNVVERLNFDKKIHFFKKNSKLYTNTKNPFIDLAKLVFLFQTSYDMSLQSQIRKIHYNNNEHYYFYRFSGVGIFLGQF